MPTANENGRRPVLGRRERTCLFPSNAVWVGMPKVFSMWVSQSHLARRCSERGDLDLYDKQG